MISILKLLIGSILTSLYIFPFEFSFLPGINTKMMMAVSGIAFFVFDVTRKRKGALPKWLVLLVMGASTVSLAGLFSITFNDTTDTAYVSYIISMLVWLAASYALCRILMIFDGGINVDSLCKYISIVCVVQCILALLIDSYPAVQLFVDRYISQGQEFLHEVERLYGIGASLDTAGTRFSAALIMIANTLTKKGGSLSKVSIYLYLTAFLFISIVGNIIARTTLVGIAVAMLLVALNRVFRFYGDGARDNRIAKALLLSLFIAVPICVFEYNHSASFQKLLRFGFEGFFSLVEKGHWEVSSNDTLEGMAVFPDNIKTWVIGDGYFENQRNDINYVGDATERGYYMGTDVGYLRFIFYFGVMGLLSFIIFFFMAAKLAGDLNPEDRVLPYFILLAGAIFWLKVATDTFLVFALFICAGYLHKDEPDEEQIPDKTAETV